MTDVTRQLEVFRTVLVYAGIRNTPRPLPSPQLDPVDEFWSRRLSQYFRDTSELEFKRHLIQATAKLAEEIAWEYDSELAPSSLNVNDTTSFGELYGDWFVTVMQPSPAEVKV